MRGPSCHLNSISDGTVVEGFSEADVVNAGLRIDQGEREDARRQVLDTLQVTLGVASDEAVAEQLGVSVDQLDNTVLVRSAQNADDPQDFIAELQADPQYQANAERRRLANVAAYAIADGSGYGATLEDIGLDGIIDLAVQGDIIENSGAVDAVLADLSHSLGPNGETVTINLTQEQRNEIALARGFLNRNMDALGLTSDDVEAHIGMRANTLHWQNQSRQGLIELQAQGLVPEFGYVSGQQLDVENNAERTAWALGVADETSDQINAWQAERIGVTQGIRDATGRLEDHWQSRTFGNDQVVEAIHYTFGGGSGYTAALQRLQENPSVDEIQEFRDYIDEVLNNDSYYLSDETRAMIEGSRAEFDEALAGAQRTRDAAEGDENLETSQAQYEDMQEEFDRVVDESGGALGRFNRELLSLDDQYLGVHADATEEEITAFEVLASIPEAERTVEQNTAYAVFAQGLLGKNLTSGTSSGATRFDQGDQLAEGYEQFINDNSKQSIVLGSAIVGTAVGVFNPVAGGVIIVGGTGVGLSLDKATGNDDLTWREVGTETGISFGSVLTGFGVSRAVSGGARFISPTSRGGQLALGGGVFLTEEVASEALINTGAAWMRGEDINAQTLFDPVGLLYGLPFAAGDARRIINSPPSPNAGLNPVTARAGAGDPGPLPPTQTPGPQVPDYPNRTYLDSATPPIGGTNAAAGTDGVPPSTRPYGIMGSSSGDGNRSTHGAHTPVDAGSTIGPGGDATHLSGGDNPLPQLTSGTPNSTYDFVNVSSIEDLRTRIPDHAERLAWTPAEDGIQQGIKWRWTDGDGNQWRVRAHERDPNAPSWVDDNPQTRPDAGRVASPETTTAGWEMTTESNGLLQTNASDNWVYRVEVKPANGPWRYVDWQGNAHRTNVMNENSQHYRPDVANDTHIPFRDPRPALNAGPETTMTLDQLRAMPNSNGAERTARNQAAEQYIRELYGTDQGELRFVLSGGPGTALNTARKTDVPVFQADGDALLLEVRNYATRNVRLTTEIRAQIDADALVLQSAHPQNRPMWIFTDHPPTDRLIAYLDARNVPWIQYN